MRTGTIPVISKSILQRTGAALMLVTASMLLLTGYLKAADSLDVSVSGLIENALNNSDRVKASMNSVEVSEGQKLSSMGGFLPHFTLSEAFTRGNDPVYAFGTKLRQSNFTEMDFALPSLNEPDALTNYSTRLVVEQPLFNGGRHIYGRKMASAGLEASRNMHEYEKLQIAFSVRQAYCHLLLARESLAVIDASLAAASSHYDQAKSRLDAGMATRADELKASVRLAELKQQRIKVLNVVTVAGEYLKLAAGVKNDQPVRPSESCITSEPEFNLDALISFAKSGNSQLAAAGFAAQAADYGARAAWGEFIPSVNAFAQVQSDATDPFGSDGDNWMVGVSADWKFFAGLSNVGKVKSARANREKANHEYNLLGHKIEVEVREAFLETQASWESIAVARGATEQADESLRIIENQYDEGLATITDLLDTEAAATASKLSLAQAMFEYNLSLASLELATGGFDVYGNLR